MLVNPTYIIEYLKLKFSNDYRLSSDGEEFTLPSIFLENDYKRHMSINTQTGMWQCFKSGNKGNFIHLISILEGVSYKQAYDKVLISSFGIEEKEVSLDINEDHEELDFRLLIPVHVGSYNNYSDEVQEAWNYLYKRKLFDVEDPTKIIYYITTQQKYYGRIIIPFEKNGGMYFFQARAYKEGIYPKYLNPPYKSDIRKASNILYPFDETKDYIVVTEGPIDAISFFLQGINATCTMGSNVSQLQAEQLKHIGCEIILAYDSDESGCRGISKFEKLRKELMMPKFYVALPSGSNDWNQQHAKGIDLSYAISEKQLYEWDFPMLKSL